MYYKYKLNNHFINEQIQINTKYDTINKTLDRKGTVDKTESFTL